MRSYIISEKWRVKNPYVKWKVKSEKWRIHMLSEKWRVKSEESNGLSEDTARNECWAKPNQTSCSRFAKAILCPSSHVLMFSCLSKNHVLLFSCLPQNHVLLFSCLSPKTMFFCSHVSPKKHVLLSNATCVVRFGDRTSYS